MPAARRNHPRVNARARQALAARAERPLLCGVRAGLALVLLTPLVVTDTTLFPFVVGKALYARTVIEAVVCLWTCLVLLQPAYRPPRSMILLLLAAGLVAYALSAWLGVSPTRSVWSTYRRMQGLVDAVHWYAFVLVAASVLRTPAAVRALLIANLGVGLLVACIAIVGYFGADVPPYRIYERDAPRIGSVLGNATYLGAYAAINAILAVGFLVLTFAPPRPARVWAPRAFAAATAAASLLALIASGSFTALVAIGGGLVFLLAGAAFVRSKALRRLALAFAVLGGGVAASSAAFLFPAAFPALAEGTFAHPVVQRLADANVRHSSFRKRQLAWRAGLAGFAERPVFGWGPENFIVVFGRHATGIGRLTELHDYAHNKLVEEAATKGLLGLACHLALWLFAFRTIVRAARRGEPGERALAWFVGAAFAAFFLQQQALFDTQTLTLQLMLLLVFVVVQERAGGERRAGQGGRALARPLAWLRRATNLAAGRTGVLLARVAFGCVMAAGVAAAAASNHAILSATRSLQNHGPVLATAARPAAHIEQAIDDFKPMANSARLKLIRELAQEWPAHRLRRGVEAKRLLARAEREGALALAAEPQNWMFHAMLAYLYCTAAQTESGYLGRAAREHAKTLALAPRLDSFLPANMALKDRCRRKIARDAPD